MCDDVQLIPVEQNKVEEPTRCVRDGCGSMGMQLVHVRCDFSDKQMIRLQETPGKSLFFFFGESDKS